MRLPVTNADPRGRLFSFDEVGVRFGHPIYRLRWSNSDGLVIHDYVVDDGSLTPLN